MCGVSLPRDLPVLVDNNICIVDIWMNNSPVASVMFRDNILRDHGPLNKIINHSKISFVRPLLFNLCRVFDFSHG
jgi:hypothetical protein